MNMTIKEEHREAYALLTSAGVPEASHDAWHLLAHILKEEPLTLRLRTDRELNEEQIRAFHDFVQRRAAREPLQYIEGETEFMGIRLRVDPRVLVPRYDTETLCQEALKWIRPGDSVLDIGTGSGAVAIVLSARCPEAKVTAVDISLDALQVAKENGARNRVPVEWKHSDVFSALQGKRYQMIVSNPPYINSEEMAQLMPEVNREPHLALYGGEDGLAYYRRICSEAEDHLTPGGRILFEIGWQQKDAVSQLLEAHIGKAYALKDLEGNWRVVGATRERA